MDPAALQILARRLQGLAEQMGVTVIRSSASANIKERRDLSTALFMADGTMVAQAEHQPVHLGALPDAVAACLRLDLESGQTAVLNDPFRGGSHLPDLTMVTAVASEGRRIGFVASRAHHADMGGPQPGSMPAGARSIFGEGLRIPPIRLDGADGAVMEILLANVRNPAERAADVRAQLAGQRRGVCGLREVAQRYGTERLIAGAKELLAYAERQMRAAIRSLPDGTYEAIDYLEGDGIVAEDIPIKCLLTIHADALEIDFSGSADQQPGNLNCPMAVTKAASYFAVRAACAPDLLASGGAFRPILVIAPEGSIVNARSPAGVAGGNVETSCRIVDVVMAALSSISLAAAQGQGTMNNLTLGNDRFTYYETIGGGQGADGDRPGPDCVHVTMSNTLNTPVEALETGYPLRVERYEMRRGSGGRGKHQGGCGVIRSIRVLEPATVSILSDRRRRAPRGSQGGEPGAVGQNWINDEPLGSKVMRDLACGDVVTIMTPGGGGFGVPDEQSEAASSTDEQERPMQQGTGRGATLRSRIDPVTNSH
jgi:N-methylhydantoinase B